jgi:hypothetical protein
MSEAPHAAPKAKGDIKLPGLGPVPRKWFIIVGGGAVLTIAYVLYKKRTGAAAAAPATGAGTSALSGQPCTDENGNPGVYDDTGTCQVDTSALGGYYAGTGAGGVSGVTPPVPGTGGFTTNGQWTQQAEADMEATGADPATLSAALGAYITGQPLTTAQQSLVDQAIAMEGYPPVAGPNGMPPALNAQPAGGQTQAPGTCGTGYTYSDSNPGTTGVIPATGGTGFCVPVASTGGGGTGGTGGGGTGGGTTAASAKPPSVTGLKATSETKTSIMLTWAPAARATSYQVRVTYQTKVAQTHMVTGTSFTVTGLAANRTYGLHVVAINSAGWADEASIVQKTLS